jgi:hypothetical protein
MYDPAKCVPVRHFERLGKNMGLSLSIPVGVRSAQRRNYEKKNHPRSYGVVKEEKEKLRRK